VAVLDILEHGEAVADERERCARRRVRAVLGDSAVDGDAAEGRGASWANELAQLALASAQIGRRTSRGSSNAARRGSLRRTRLVAPNAARRADRGSSRRSRLEKAWLDPLLSGHDFRRRASDVRRLLSEVSLQRWKFGLLAFHR
jgi:hypothetical protein